MMIMTDQNSKVLGIQLRNCVLSFLGHVRHLLFFACLAWSCPMMSSNGTQSIRMEEAYCSSRFLNNTQL